VGAHGCGLSQLMVGAAHTRSHRGHPPVFWIRPTRSAEDREIERRIERVVLLVEDLDVDCQIGHEDARFTLRVYTQATKRRERLSGPHLRV
jgi:hypothetical protein